MRDGKICLEYPPTERSALETLEEVRRCTQQGIIINPFMLGMDYYAERFIDDVASINHGRAFLTFPENLGGYILAHYLHYRQDTIA